MSRLNPFIVTAEKNEIEGTEKHEFFIQPAPEKDSNWFMKKHSGRLYFNTKSGVKSYLKRKGFINIKGV